MVDIVTTASDRPRGIYIISIWLSLTSFKAIFTWSTYFLEQKGSTSVFILFVYSKALIALTGAYLLYRLRAAAVLVISLLLIGAMLDIYFHIIGFYSSNSTDIPLTPVFALRFFLIAGIVSYVWWYKKQGILK